ncbi:MAG: UDP-N-acetylenolpyruvoylglucosamine reductase [Syntrophus sp. (in: bacteria)]|nr:UDP-N-acetylenolpyruvoylglucosamine reductase [Syntrophus sp. (in: bacteria)]
MEWKSIKGTLMKDVPMKRYTSMKVGGQAAFLAYPTDETDLADTLQFAGDKGIGYRFLGNGTNVIVSDKGINETLIRITKMKHTRYIKTKWGALADVSGGVSLRAFIKDTAQKGLSGLEKLYWIPGTVGGGIKMNAGSFGQSISDTLEEIRLINGKSAISTLTKDQLQFGYRKSPVHRSDCVISARFALKNRDKKEMLRDMDYVYSERKKRHPMEYPSAGSVFKSVGSEPAWKLIEKAGLKGFSLGGAQVSEKHTNFIVNLGWAKAQDIKDLIERIKKEVYEKLGVTLVEEVELWGFNG